MCYPKIRSVVWPREVSRRDISVTLSLGESGVAREEGRTDLLENPKKKKTPTA